MYYRTKKGGFTLFELIIVIAIIGILSMVVMLFLSGVKARGRDAKRERDIHEIGTALGLYYEQNRIYPHEANQAAENEVVLTGSDYASLALTNSKSIGSIPLDPFQKDNFTYRYTPRVNATSYNLVVCFETVQGLPNGCKTITP